MDIVKQLFILLVLIVIIGSIFSNKNSAVKQEHLTLYNSRGEIYQGYRQAGGTIKAYSNKGEKVLFKDNGDELYWKDDNKEDFERAGAIAGRSITK